jgi:DnaJ-class molecular chaperone
MFAPINLSPLCSNCDGIGTLAAPQFVDCPICKGSGAVWGEKCLGCGGNGGVVRILDSVCPVCGGRGATIVDAEPPVDVRR